MLVRHPMRRTVLQDRELPGPKCQVPRLRSTELENGFHLYCAVVAEELEKIQVPRPYTQ